MNLYEYQRSRPFIDLYPRSLRFNILKLLFLKQHWVNWSQISYWASMGYWDENCSNVPGHMAKMASRFIYGKSLEKNPSSEPRSRWSWNLVYSFGHSSTIKFLQMKTLGWPCPFLFFKWRHWVDLAHFYDTVKFVSWCFCMGESL